MRPIDAAKIAKLPRWARYLIEALQADIAAARKTHGEIADRKTRVSFGYEDPVYLPDTVYDFRLGEDWRDTMHVSIKNDRGRRVLDITSSWSSVSIQPEAANHFTVRGEL